MLFDYQHFERNASLETLIRETETRYDRSLSDDDLTFVNAAGDVNVPGGTINNNVTSSTGSTCTKDIIGKY